MILNVLIDAAMVVIRVLGDLFDFVWKAKLRNVLLLEKHLAMPCAVHRQSRGNLVGLETGIIAVVALTVTLLGGLLQLILGAL